MPVIDRGKISAEAGVTDSGRAQRFLVKISSPVRLAEVMKLFKKLRKIVILLVVEILQISIHNGT